MELLSQFKEAMFNLRSAKLRSCLAMLGILVGTASVVAMVSSGELAEQAALKQFKQLGTDLLSVSIETQHRTAETEESEVQNISVNDIMNMPTQIKELLLVAPYTTTFVPTVFQGHPIDAMIIGSNQSLQTIGKITLKKGRFVSDLDEYSFYCVLGHQVYETMKKYSISDPVGQQIQLGKMIFTIVGVMNEWPTNQFFNADLNHTLVIPIKSAALLSKYAVINNLIMRVQEHIDISQVKDKITNYINKHVQGKHLYFRSAKELIKNMEAQSQIYTLLLGLIGSISLLVGGIGVMNIMLVSVVERHREIGIRLAIGAHKRDIRKMFLIESIVLSLLGGICGVLIGVFISFFIAEYANWTFELFVLPPIVGFGVSVFIGVFFGYYPALQASRLDPIQTLRTD